MSSGNSTPLLNMAVNYIHRARLINHDEKSSVKEQISELPNETESASLLIKLTTEQVLTYTNKINELIDLPIIMGALSLDLNNAGLVEALCEFTSLRKNHNPSNENCKKMYSLILSNPLRADIIVSLWDAIQRIKNSNNSAAVLCDNVEDSLLVQLKHHTIPLFVHHADADENCLTFLASNNPGDFIKLLAQLAQQDLLNDDVRGFLNSTIITSIPTLTTALSTYKQLFTKENIIPRLKILSKYHNCCDGAKDIKLFWRNRSQIPNEYKAIYEACVFTPDRDKTKIQLFTMLHKELGQQLTIEDATVICLAIEHHSKIDVRRHAASIINFYQAKLYSPINKLLFLKYLSADAYPKIAWGVLKSIKEHAIIDEEEINIILNAVAPEKAIERRLYLKTYFEKNPDLQKLLHNHYSNFPLRPLTADEFSLYQKELAEYVLPNQKELKDTSFAEAHDIIFSQQELFLLNSAKDSIPRLMSEQITLGMPYLYNKLLNKSEHSIRIKLINWLYQNELFTKGTLEYLLSIDDSILDFQKTITFLTNKNFFDSSEKKQTFDKLINNPYSNVYSDALKIIYAKAPKLLRKESIFSFLSHPNKNIADLIIIYKPLLTDEFDFFFNYINSNESNDEKKFNLKYQQGLLLASLSHSQLYNHANRDTLLAQSLENLAWFPRPYENKDLVTHEITPDNILFNVHNSQAYFDFMTTPQRNITEKRKLYDITPREENIEHQISTILQHTNILFDDEWYTHFTGRMPNHLVTANFFDGLLNRCSTANRTDAEKIHACIEYVNEVIQLNRQRIDNPVLPSNHTINYSQSAHNHAVTKTAVQSALNLVTLYKTKCATINVVTKEILNHIQDKKLTPLKARAINNSLTRIKNSSLNYTKNEISIQQLLLCNWAAVYEQNKTLLHEAVTLDAAKDAVVNGLYEMQRAYNLDENDEDNGASEDSFSCTEGSFNIIASCLRTIHKSVEIHLITQKQASYKFQQLSNKEVKLHLQQQKNQLDEIEFMKLLESLKKDGIQSIWQIIENSIETAMINEFGSLYDNKKEHSKFREIMDNYIDVDIDPILDSYYTISQSTDIDAEINESNEPIRYNHLSNSASSSASSSGLKHARSLSDNEENEEHLVKRSNNIRVEQSSSSSSSSSSGLKHSRTIDSDGEEENNEEPVLKRVKNTLSTQNPFRLFANNAQNNNAFSNTMEHEYLDSEDEHSIHQNAAT